MYQRKGFERNKGGGNSPKLCRRDQPLFHICLHSTLGSVEYGMLIFPRKLLKRGRVYLDFGVCVSFSCATVDSREYRRSEFSTKIIHTSFFERQSNMDGECFQYSSTLTFEFAEGSLSESHLLKGGELFFGFGGEGENLAFAIVERDVDLHAGHWSLLEQR